MSNFFYDQYFEDKSRTIRLLNQGALVIKGFLDSIPEVNITNEWGDSGSTIITTLIEGARNIARNSYFRRAADMLGSNFGSDEQDAGFIPKALEWMKTATNVGVKSTESYIKSFNWSTVSISGLQLNALLINDTNDKDVYTEWIKPLIELTTSKTEGRDKFGGVIGIQMPPNEYEVNYENAMSGVMKGSFTLEIGAMFKFDNIIVSSINVSPSTTVVMNADGSATTKPSFYKIALSFEFARLLDREDLNKYMYI